MATEKKEKQAQDEDVKVFVLHQHKIKTIKDTEEAVPRISWGKEIQIMDLLAEVMTNLTGSGVLRPDTTPAEDIASVIGAAVREVPKKLEEVTCILLEKDKEWVRDNLESEEMLGLVLPFLYAKRQTLGKTLAPYLTSLAGSVGKVVQKLAA